MRDKGKPINFSLNNMSIESIDLLWDQTIDKLQRLVQEETSLPDPQTKLVSISDAYHHFAKLYIRYSIVLSEFNTCYEKSIQPQKRLDIKCTIERVVGRVINLRHLLVKWCPPNPDVVSKGSAAAGGGSGSSNQAPFPWEYFDLSNQLKELSLTPDQLEITTPVFYTEDQKEGIRKRNLLIDRLMQQQQSLSDGPKRKQLMDDTRWDAEIVPATSRDALESSIAVVLSSPSEAGSNMIKEEGKIVSLDENLPDRAAAKVQSIVRGHLSRKVTSHKKQWLDRYIGLEHDRAELIKLEKNLADIKARRFQEQQYRKERYENDLHRLKDVVKEEEGFAIQSMLREERIKWITDHAITKNMLPDTFEGFYAKDIPPADEKEVQAAKAEKDKDAKSKGKKNNAKDAEDNKGSKNKKSTVVDDVEHPVLNAPHTLLDPIKECINTYETRWKQRNIGPDRTKSQHHDVDMAKDSIVRHQVKAELTKGVEEKLLSNILKIKAMQEAGVMVKKSSKDKKEGKGKDVVEKGKKEKKEKPLPGLALPGIESMTVDAMLGILVQHDLVFLPEERRVKDFIGGFENGRPTLPTPTDKQQERWIPNDPSAHQLRKAVMDYCVLPLGPGEYVRSTMKDDDNVRSILFYGPEGCGKSLVIQAIASEIGAMVINLSSATIGSSFRTNEEALKLIHMVFTVAKEKSYAPVLIYLDNCHEIFIDKKRRIPQTRGGEGEGNGEERSRRNAIQAAPLDDMNRFQKHLLIYKNTALKKEDRVLITGSTTMPELTDVKLMKWKGSDSGKPEKQGFFEHALYFPLVNHSDRVMMWRELILRRISKFNRLSLLSEMTPNPNLDLVALSLMSARVSGGEMSFIVDSILTEERVNKLAVSPLSEHEFVCYFSRLDKKQDDTRFLTFTRQFTNLDSVWKSNNPAGENGDDKKKKKK